MPWIVPVISGAVALRWRGTYNFTYCTPGMYMSFMFMYYIRKKYTGWWTKYNYILTSGLLTVLLLLVRWWGNSISSAGVDFEQSATLLIVPPEGFGPKVEEYP
ncbi:hypothetical protein V1512DRAFT_249018 [Lipomyces arxii]|uniref:uncharacterized protein n=1 Tax=Lipomyces arxii TaxID=56418 RepID=UPI0034CF9243